MTTVISPEQYCQNPQEYKNYPGITDKTRAYWDQYCSLQQQISKDDPPPPVDNPSSELVNGFLQSFTTPFGIAMLSRVMATSIIFPRIKSAIINLIQDGLDEGIMEVAEDFVKEGGSVIVANGTSLLTKLFADMTFDGAIEAGMAGRYAITYMLEAAEFLGEIVGSFLGPAELIMLVVQLIGMIFSSIDPCNLDVMMSAEDLLQFSNNMNNAFRNKVLVSVDSIQDTYGNISIGGDFPIEFYAENSILPTLKQDYYDPIRQKLFMQYMNTLQYNSNGQPIYYPPGGRLIQNKDIQGMELSTFNFLGNNNTVVENWMIKYWPVMLGVFVLIVLFFIWYNRK